MRICDGCHDFAALVLHPRFFGFMLLKVPLGCIHAVQLLELNGPLETCALFLVALQLTGLAQTDPTFSSAQLPHLQPFTLFFGNAVNIQIVAFSHAELPDNAFWTGRLLVVCLRRFFLHFNVFSLALKTRKKDLPFVGFYLSLEPLS